MAAAKKMEETTLKHCGVKKMSTEGGNFGPSIYFTLVEDENGKLYKVEIVPQDCEWFVIGSPIYGKNVPYRVSVEVYDEDQEKWTELSNKKKWPGTIFGYYSTTYYNNAIYLFGGVNTLELGNKSGNDDLWRFSLQSNTWDKVKICSSSSRPLPRVFHSAFMMNSKLVIFGGGVDMLTMLRDMWVIDLKEAEKGEATWRSLPFRGPFPDGPITQSNYSFGPNVYVMDIVTQALWNFNTDSLVWSKIEVDRVSWPFLGIRTFCVGGHGNKLLIHGVTRKDGYQVIALDTNTLKTSPVVFQSEKSKENAKAIFTKEILVSTVSKNGLIVSPVKEMSKERNIYRIELGIDDNKSKDQIAGNSSPTKCQKTMSEVDRWHNLFSLPYDRNSNHIAHVFLTAVHDFFENEESG